MAAYCDLHLQFDGLGAHKVFEESRGKQILGLRGQRLECRVEGLLHVEG